MMKAFALLLASITLLCLPASAEADPLKIVVFGDSLTSGYQLQPDEAFGIKLDKKIREIGFQDVEVINMSISSDTSADGAQRVDEVLKKHPDIVIVAFGLNEVMGGAKPNSVHQNISLMMQKLLAVNIYTILLGVKAPTALGVDYGQQLDAVYVSLANGYRVPFYQNALEGIAEKSKYTLADGYRPNAQGVDIMVEGVYRLVDAGLRWRLEVLRYQEEYRKSQMPQDSQ